MQDYAQQFVELAINRQALQFGDFTLKSGQKSPFFFHIAAISDGQGLAQLGRYYAALIMDKQLSFDMIFGPAYKGIHLACAVAISLATEHGLSVPFAYNRKEAKTHGEGGNLIGAPLSGNVLIIDDVITKGIASTEAIDYIQTAGATPAGLVVAVDRQVPHENGTIAMHLQDTYHMPVHSLTTLATIQSHHQQ